MSQAVVIAPTMESILAIHGIKDGPVTNVTVKGLEFSVTNTPLKVGGFGAGAFNGAVQLVHATDCRLVDLAINNTGGQGIKGRVCKALRLENCDIMHTGACGVKVDGVDCTITNNSVHHIGITYPSAIAVWIGGQQAEVSHNEIHDTPYTAIAAGGDNHYIESNLIYRAMQVLHDGAGMYITFCKNIVVRGNIVWDITETGGYGASAYYLDEQAEGCVVEANLSERVIRPSHNHMARKNTIRDNVFIVEGDAVLTFPKCADFTFARNIVRADEKLSIKNPAAITSHTDNIYFSAKGEYEGIPDDSVKSDTLFINTAKDDYRFRRESPAATLSLRTIDVRGAGRRK